MSKEIISNAEERMDKAIQSAKRELASLRAGRANPSLLDKIVVEYYGSMMPVNQVASISTPDSRTLLIQPWDKSTIGTIERAIMKSDLGLSPANDGEMIRIVIPALTEQRRAELVKLSKKYIEEAKVAVRNIRRDSNDELKKLEKSGLSEDESRRFQEDVQKLTDRFISDLDKVLAVKEKEIMDV